MIRVWEARTIHVVIIKMKLNKTKLKTLIFLAGEGFWSLSSWMSFHLNKDSEGGARYQMAGHPFQFIESVNCNFTPVLWVFPDSSG